MDKPIFAIPKLADHDNILLKSSEGQDGLLKMFTKLNRVDQ